MGEFLLKLMAIEKWSIERSSLENIKRSARQEIGYQVPGWLNILTLGQNRMFAVHWNIHRLSKWQISSLVKDKEVKLGVHTFFEPLKCQF